MKSPFRGQTTQSTFTLDWRNVAEPYIGEGFLNMFTVGELYYKGKGCENFQAEPMHFFKDGDGHVYT